jgi:hypothetical protein
MRRRGSAIAAVLLALTFSVGALTGMAVEEAAGIDWFDFLEDDRQPNEKDLLNDLGLSPAQRAQAERILEHQEEALEEYWEQRLPDIERIVAQSYAEIRLLLTPPQQSTFDKRVRSLDSKLPDEVRDR